MTILSFILFELFTVFWVWSRNLCESTASASNYVNLSSGADTRKRMLSTCRAHDWDVRGSSCARGSTTTESVAVVWREQLKTSQSEPSGITYI